MDKIENIRLNSLKFFNYPKEYITEDYERVQNEITSNLLSYSDIVGIYSFGSISAPGISDIDLIIIFDESITKTRPMWVEQFGAIPNLKKIFKSKVNKMSKRERKKNTIKDDLMIHAPVIAPKGVIKNFSKLLAIFSDPKCIYIKGVENIKKTDEKYFINIFLDYPIMSEVLELLSYLINRNINVRRTLVKLNNIKYTLYMAKSFGVWESSYDEYINSVRKLRADWFNLTESEKRESIYLLLKQYINITFELTWKAAYKLENILNVDVNKNKQIFYTHPSQYTIFTNKFDKNEILNKQIHLIQDDIKVRIYPYIYSIQLQAYSSQNNSWARFLRKYLFENIFKSDFSFIPNHNERTDVLSHYIEELNKKSLLLGTGPPNFGYHTDNHPWMLKRYSELRVKSNEKQLKDMNLI